MRIGEIAELAGVTTRTVRHCHRVGLLPEPPRRPNGYRSYGLRDAARLVRIRRLVQLGLNLDEVADALADDDGRELRAILTELDADLADREARVRAQRERIAELLADEGDLSTSPQVAATMHALTEAAGPDHPSLERERMVLHVLEPLGAAHAPDVVGTYRSILTDPELADPLLETMRRFEPLADVPADDPAVTALAADAAAVVATALCRTLPSGVPPDPAVTRTAELLRQAIDADISPAQARCLDLMVQHCQRASPRSPG